MIPNPVPWLAGRPLWLQCLLGFAAGALGVLAFAPWFLFPLFFIAFPVLVWLVCAARSRGAAALIGWMFGFGHFVFGFAWVANALEIAGAPSAAWLALPLGMAFYPAIGMALLWQGARRTGATLATVVLFATIWCLMEWLRGHLFTGFPWNLAGYTWGFSDAMAQFAALGGIYGLTFLTVLAAALPAALAGQHAGGRRALVAAGLTVSILIGLLVFGLVRLPEESDAERMRARIDQPTVRIVQANISQEDKWRPELLADHFIRYLTMSDTRGAGKVDLLLWPEAAIPYRLDQDPARTVMIGRRLDPGALVLTGFPRRSLSANGQVAFHNSMIVIDQTGADLGVYDKAHLVPFGEYVPGRGIFQALGIEKLVEGAGDFVPGPGPRVLDLPGYPRVSPLICYEVIFPGDVAPDGDRPDWLFNLTNDAWYGEDSGPYQHLVISRFRSIEEGLPMVRSAGTGISAIIDSYGRVEKQMGLNRRGVLDGKLPFPLPEPTLYARFGDGLFWLMVVAGLAGGAWPLLRQRRKHI